MADRVIGADPRTREARELMLAFAFDTGLDGERPPVRYLWTDAFAVCNFLEAGETELAVRLVNQVHATLGRRDPTHGSGGWLSGPDEASARDHPTRGGLRIGKALAERAPGEPLDDRLEWDRDGQYFHYLTKWMHALDQVARQTRQPRFNVWARELAQVAFHAFTYVSATGGRRMYWKMSVDLTRPLVPSMGHHDPLDGYVTYRQLQATAASLRVTGDGAQLNVEAAEFAAMLPFDLATDDPLGIGGLLADAWRVEQLRRDRAVDDSRLRDRLIAAALDGLGSLRRGDWLGTPAAYRLAFRELGLAIGLAAVPHLSEAAGPNAPADLEHLERFAPLRDQIEAFWIDPDNRTNATWLEHRNINEVMLATSLMPDGYLTL